MEKTWKRLSSFTIESITGIIAITTTIITDCVSLSVNNGSRASGWLASKSHRHVYGCAARFLVR